MIYSTSAAGYIIVLVIWLAISLGLAILTGISASHRNMNSVGWGTLVFFTWMFGLMIYLICIQPKADGVKCPSCGKRIPKMHNYCPYCGVKEN